MLHTGDQAITADNQNDQQNDGASAEVNDQQKDVSLADASNASVGDGDQPHAMGLNVNEQKSEYILLPGGRGRGIPLSNSIFYASHLRFGRQTLPPPTENAVFLWGGENGTRVSREEVEYRVFKNKKPIDRDSVIIERSIDSIPFGPPINPYKDDPAMEWDEIIIEEIERKRQMAARERY